MNHAQVVRGARRIARYQRATARTGDSAMASPLATIAVMASISRKAGPPEYRTAVIQQNAVQISAQPCVPIRNPYQRQSRRPSYACDTHHANTSRAVANTRIMPAAARKVLG